MTTLTPHGGVEEIGGSKFLLEDCDTKILLDFGMSFSARQKYYMEYLNPRTAKGLGDFLAMNLTPDVKGFYREDLLNTIGREKEECEVDALFLSHAHADHANYISFLHEDIPVHCGETAWLLLKAINESTQRNIENEVIDFKKRPLMNWKVAPVKRIFNTFRTGDKIKVGSLEIEPVHVDHSVPGAYGFIIHTTEGAVIYTGDLRLHGLHPEMTHDFIEKAADSKPIAMLCEGTRIKERWEDSSEAKVRKTSGKIVKQANKNNKFVISDFNFKDIDRMQTFFNIAVENDRKFLITLKGACFLKWVSKDEKFKNIIPKIKDENIGIYQPKRRTGTYREQDYAAWERMYLKYDNIYTADDVSRNQDKFIATFTFYNMNELIDIQPTANSIYIHSLSEPFNEEMEIDYERLKNWLRLFKMKMYQSHASGHATGSDIAEMVRKIKPKQLFPIHTEYPKLFKKLIRKKGIDITIVELGKKYKI